MTNNIRQSIQGSSIYMHLDKILNLYIDNNMTMMQSVRIENANEYGMRTCTYIYTHFHQNRWPSLLIFFPLSFFFGPKDFDWQTHAFKKKKRKIAMTISGLRNVCDYDGLILCFISSIQGGSSITICQERHRKMKKKKGQDGKAIKNYCLVWKMLTY